MTRAARVAQVVSQAPAPDPETAALLRGLFAPHRAKKISTHTKAPTSSAPTTEDRGVTAIPA